MCGPPAEALLGATRLAPQEALFGAKHRPLICNVWPSYAMCGPPAEASVVSAELAVN
jgi:hypothetical protein